MVYKQKIKKNGGSVFLLFFVFLFLNTFFLSGCLNATEVRKDSGIPVESPDKKALSEAKTKDTTDKSALNDKGILKDTGSFDNELPPLPSYDHLRLKVALLENAKRELENYRLFASNFYRRDARKEIALLEEIVRKYISRYVDGLIGDESSRVNLETFRLITEIMFLKAEMFIYFEDFSGAGDIIDNMRKKFKQYSGVVGDFPQKYASLEQGINALNEMMQDVKSKKKKGGQ
ncbi:MAG: hypothetical protein HY754_01620 [Nitrospirae bacterium]|nr:hypothetical protein [Nitrospirota bacterium]